jgi:uncharacterized protein
MAKALVPRINIVTFGVHDMVMMRGFYERLGLKASSASNQHVTFFNLNGLVLGLFGYDSLADDAAVQVEPMKKYKGMSVAWNTTSEAETDLVMAHAKSAGAKILKPAQKVFWGGYSGYFADPESNLWEVAYNPFFAFDDHGNLVLP